MDRGAILRDYEAGSKPLGANEFAILSQVEPFCSEVRHPRGDPRALEAQPGRVQARKAKHLQES